MSSQCAAQAQLDARQELAILIDVLLEDGGGTGKLVVKGGVVGRVWK